MIQFFFLYALSVSSCQVVVFTRKISFFNRVRWIELFCKCVEPIFFSLSVFHTAPPVHPLRSISHYISTVFLSLYWYNRQKCIRIKTVRQNCLCKFYLLENSIKLHMNDAWLASHTHTHTNINTSFVENTVCAAFIQNRRLFCPDLSHLLLFFLAGFTFRIMTDVWNEFNIKWRVCIRYRTSNREEKNKPFRIGHYSNIFKCIASARILSIN